METKILELGILEIKIPNMNELSEEDYALVRKDSFGGSDSSILCGVNLYKTIDELIEEKNNKYITDAEKEVGNKPIVRKGRELEPLILDKAAKELNTEVVKPTAMYVFKSDDAMTLNYDGITEIDNKLIPIEAKLVSKFGEKYYNKDVTIDENKELDMKLEGDSLETHIKRKALKIGIPPYYYTQVQQELMGVDAPYGYLAAMFDDSWTFKLYLVKQDKFVQSKIAALIEEYKDKIKRNS